VKHTRQCATDSVASDYCEDIHAEDVRFIESLHGALTAIYSIAGENQEIATLCRDAVLETGGEWSSSSKRKAANEFRLKQAAPDLLAACMRLRAVITDHVSLADVDALDAAIAKAIGA